MARARRSATEALYCAGCGTPERLGQTSTADELHREIRPSVHLPDIVNLHDMGMLQGGDRFRLPRKPGQFRRAGVLARQEHFESGSPLELAVADAIDDAVAAPSQDGEHFITRDVRQWGARMQSGAENLGSRRGREYAFKQAIDPAALGEALRHFHQQLRVIRAHLRGRQVGAQRLFDQLKNLHMIAIGLRW